MFDQSKKDERGFVTNLVMEDLFTAVESKTGDKITGAVLDDTGKYSVGSTYLSGTDNAGGTWTYTVNSVQVAVSPLQNPAYNGYIYDATYYDHDLNTTFNTNVGAKGYAGISPQNVSGKSYFGSDNDSVSINGKSYKIGYLYVVPDPVLAVPTPIISQLSVIHHDQSFAASSLFTASDPDAIATFGLWNTGNGGGHFVLNGVAQGTNQEIDVTAAQLSRAELPVRLRYRHAVGARQRRHAVERLVEQLHRDRAGRHPAGGDGCESHGGARAELRGVGPVHGERP